MGLPDVPRIMESWLHQLSGGQRQRVLIAMAKMSGTPLIVADEPTTALDVTVQVQILRVLRQLAEEQGTAIFYVTHDLSPRASSRIALAVVAPLGSGLLNILVAVVIFWWPWYARIMRAGILAQAARLHVEAARLSGVPGLCLLWRYLLSGALPTLLVTSTLDVTNVVLTPVALLFPGPRPACPGTRTRGHNGAHARQPHGPVVAADHAGSGDLRPVPGRKPRGGWVAVGPAGV